MTGTAATFAAVFVALFVAHHVADHWVQTEHQAAAKDSPGWSGRLTCVRHVASYTATTTVMVAAAVLLLTLPVTAAGIATGQAVSAVTHYWADRRTTLRWLADRLRKQVFYRLGAPRDGHDDNPTLGTGAHALDQSFHYWWLLVAAFCTTLI